jgi:hypothetical protein
MVFSVLQMVDFNTLSVTDGWSVLFLEIRLDFVAWFDLFKGMESVSSQTVETVGIHFVSLFSFQHH